MVSWVLIQAGYAEKTLFLSGLQGQSFSTNAGLLFSMVDHPRPLFFLRPSTQPI